MIRYIKIILLVLLSIPCFSCSKDNTDPDPTPGKGGVAPAVDPNHFTILSWTGVKNQYADYGFQKLIEAGFNTYLDWYDNISEAEVALDAADSAGIKMVISCPELHSDTKNVVNTFKKHKSFFLYHIEDEPEVSEFSTLAGQIKNIQQYDTDHSCYVNLYPNWCWGEDVYKSRVQLFVKNVPVKFLSFDNYPCKKIGSEVVVRPDWYHNLEDIRAVAKDKVMPFWGFALSLSHATKEASYPIPTIGELRLQQFSNLVYGATGFQYFTTWGHLQDEHMTQVYPLVKQVNSELLALESIFLNADIKYVWHIGETIPSGTKKLTKAPEGISKIETDDGNAVVSYLVNNDKKYIAIVNSNPNGGMNLDVQFEEGVKAEKYDQNAKVSEYTPGVIRLAAGNIVIYSWK